MRMYIKEQILAGKKKNFALIVPTKALINEVRSEIIQNDLQDRRVKYSCGFGILGDAKMRRGFTLRLLNSSTTE